MMKTVLSQYLGDGVQKISLNRPHRLNAIVREMSNTLLRTARSAVLAVVRDFSCAIVTADNQLLCPGEGLPVHIFGSSLQSQSMCDLHQDLAPGDAFLHNDPYLGNTHPADHMIMCPVIVDGEHLFTAKELTVDPGAKATIKDNGAYGLSCVQGIGKINGLALNSPKLIRFHELTEDEYFVTEDGAKAGVTFENTSETEPLVILRYFGPEVNPNAPAMGAYRKNKFN